MPSTSASHTVTIPRTSDALWVVLQRAETWANIGPVDRVWDPVHSADGQLASYRWSAQVVGKEYLGTANIVDSVAPSLMKLELDGGEVTGFLTATLTEHERGTDVQVVLDVSSRGAMSAMFFPVIADAIRKGLPQQVDAFATRLTEDS